MKTGFKKSDFKKVICCSDIKTRKQFKEKFSLEIDNFITLIFDAYKEWQKLDDKCKNDDRASITAVFFFNAINHLVVSFNLLLSCYMVPAGNLMRQVLESLAMAILISSKKMQEFEKFKKEPKKYPVFQAMNLVNQSLPKLNINYKAWSTVWDTWKFYHQWSHPAYLSLIDRFDFSTMDKIILGGMYDSGKVFAYKKEIKQRIALANLLKNTIIKITNE